MYKIDKQPRNNIQFGKYGHSLVITLKRVWSIKNIESLCCTLKINIILQINFNEK